MIHCRRQAEESKVLSLLVSFKAQYEQFSLFVFCMLFFVSYYSKIQPIGNNTEIVELDPFTPNSHLVHFAKELQRIHESKDDPKKSSLTAGLSSMMIVILVVPWHV